MRFAPTLLLATIGSIGFALGDVPPNAPERLKTAYRSLAEMGLSLKQAGHALIAGAYGVAVPHSAIIEEDDKTYVVILDTNDASKSKRVEVQLGNRDDKLVHTRNKVTAGDYVVVRKEAEVVKQPTTPKQPKPETANPSETGLVQVTPSPRKLEPGRSNYVYEPAPEEREEPTPSIESPAFSLRETPTRYPEDRFQEVPYPEVPVAGYFEPSDPGEYDERHFEISEADRYFEPEQEIYHPFPSGDIRNTFENFGFGDYRPPCSPQIYIPECGPEIVPEERSAYRCEEEGLFRRFLRRFD